MTVIEQAQPFTLDPSRQVAVQVFERLRELIVSLVLAPGTVLNRQDLQASFGASSTPIRDALMRLSEEGLVDVFPQSATRVSLIDVGKAGQAQFLRHAVELEAVRILCARSDKELVRELRELIEQQKDLAKRSDYQAFDASDSAFHKRIYAAAGAPDIYALVRQHSGHVDRIRRLHLPVSGKMQEVIRDHALIVKAIAAGDGEAAQTHMRAHLSSSLAYSPSLRERFPAYFKP